MNLNLGDPENDLFHYWFQMRENWWDALSARRRRKASKALAKKTSWADKRQREEIDGQ
jgi:hypothetical protein